MEQSLRVSDVASPVKVPKTAELVAAQLRNQIVRGELREGDALPPEAALMAQFGVSRPTLREAFRVLESEALISVRRGARGGAHVHTPDGDVAARYAGLGAAVPRRHPRRRLRRPQGARAPRGARPRGDASAGRGRGARSATSTPNGSTSTIPAEVDPAAGGVPSPHRAATPATRRSRSSPRCSTTSSSCTASPTSPVGAVRPKSARAPSSAPAPTRSSSTW